MTQTIESEYFTKQDLLTMQSELIAYDCIDTDPAEKDPLTNRDFLAKALDRLVTNLIAEIVNSPVEMLFGACDGSYRSMFEQAVKYVKERG